MTVAERLVSVREANGYTRKQLAEELGMPYPTITKYENGQREPGHEYLKTISRKFGVTVDYLLGLETKKSPTPSGEGMDDFTYAAHGYSGRLTDADKATLIKMMETLAAANEEEHGQADGGIQGSE